MFHVKSFHLCFHSFAFHIIYIYYLFIYFRKTLLHRIFEHLMSWCFTTMNFCMQSFGAMMNFQLALGLALTLFNYDFMWAII
jgi:hypothetical protein